MKSGTRKRSNNTQWILRITFSRCPSIAVSSFQKFLVRLISTIFLPVHSNESLLVTASHAVFHKDSSKSAPAAVVGFQFQYNALHTLFDDVTAQCTDPMCTACTSENLKCFVLDDNAYIVSSKRNLQDAGRFFGSVEGSLTKHLVDNRIYKKIIIYDYQAVCYHNRNPEYKDSNYQMVNFAKSLMTVMQLARNA